MQPERRAERHLHPQRQSDDDEADDQDDEHGRTVAGVGEGIVEAADDAALADREEAGEQPAFAAARAAALEPGRDRIDLRP